MNYLNADGNTSLLRKIEAGGVQKKWNNLTGVGQPIEPSLPRTCGEDPVDLAYELEAFNEYGVSPRILEKVTSCGD